MSKHMGGSNWSYSVIKQLHDTCKGTLLFKCDHRDLSAVAQQTECQPVNQRISGSIPSQDACLGCRTGPQQGMCERQPHIDVSFPFSPSPPLPLKVNKYIKSLKNINKCDHRLITNVYCKFTLKKPLKIIKSIINMLIEKIKLNPVKPSAKTRTCKEKGMRGNREHTK